MFFFKSESLITHPYIGFVRLSFMTGKDESIAATRGMIIILARNNVTKIIIIHNSTAWMECNDLLIYRGRRRRRRRTCQQQIAM